MKPIHEFVVASEIMSSWLGKTPREVLEAILFEYEIKFFDTYPDAINEIREVAKLKRKSWDELLHLIKALSHLAGDYSPERVFFNSVYANSGLWRQPSRKNIKSHKLYGKFLHFNFCNFCWRSVPVLYGYKPRALCSLHTFKSRSKEYRRLDRMAKKKINGNDAQQRENDLAFILSGMFLSQAGTPERYDYDTVNKLYAGSISRESLTQPDYNTETIILSLPNLHKHLIRNGIDTSNKTHIYDFLNKLTMTDDQIVKDEFIKRRQLWLADFSYCRRQLARAEIWLELEEIAKRWHGGVRKKGCGVDVDSTE